MLAPGRTRLERFSHALGNLVPDATSAPVVLLALVVCAALATGNAPSAIAGAYHRGLWMLLPFTMQVTLILVLSAVVSATPLMATPGHFLKATVGVMSLRSTIWSLPAVLMVVTFPVGVMLLTLILMPTSPRPLSAFPEANALATAPDAALPPLHPDEEPAGFAGWIEHSPVIPAMLGLVLAGWFHYHFLTKGAVQVCWPILVLYHLYGVSFSLLWFTLGVGILTFAP